MKNNIKFLTLVFLLISGMNYAQVGVGTTTPDTSAVLDITSTTKGFLMPRMTTLQRVAITAPVNGLQVYDTDTNSNWFYNGTAWAQVAVSTQTLYNANGTLTANRTVNQGANSLNFGGTGVTTFNAGNVGIGTTSPSAKLDVRGDLTVERPSDITQNFFFSPGFFANSILSSSNPLNRKWFSLESDPNSIGIDFTTNSVKRLAIDNNGNVGIGTSAPNASALLDLTSTNKGLLLPRMTTAQRVAIVTPATGLQVYDLTTNSIWLFNGTAWVQGASNGDVIERLSTVQRDALISPVDGKLIFNTTTSGLELYNVADASWGTSIIRGSFVGTRNGNASLNLSSYGGRNVFNIYKSNGTLTAPEALNINDPIYDFYGQGYTPTLPGGVSARATHIQSAVDQETTASRVPGRIILSTTRTAGTNDAPQEVMRLDANGNVGINGVANASAVLDVTSTTKGFLPPRMTSTQMAAIVAPAEGLTIYCTDCTPKTLMSYNGTAWANMTGQTGPANTTAPVISPNISTFPAGTSVTFTTTDGTWSGMPTTYTYQWQLNGANISGATNNTLTTTVVANGVYTCIIKATNAVSNTSVSSNAITINTAAPTITTPTQFQAYGNYVTITTDAVFANASSTTNSYQWTSNGTPIAGATANKLIIPANLWGTTITCEVSNSNNVGTISSTPTGVTVNGILDQVSGAAAAYGLRKLKSTYTGSAIQVRRDSDNTTQDIAFATDGTLDITALQTFVGPGSGFVATWYDQSGNAINATQATTTLQAPIVISGVVQTMPGSTKPSIYVNTAQMRMATTLSYQTSLGVTLNAVLARTAANGVNNLGFIAGTAAPLGGPTAFSWHATDGTGALNTNFRASQIAVSPGASIPAGQSAIMTSKATFAGTGQSFKNGVGGGVTGSPFMAGPITTAPIFIWAQTNNLSRCFIGYSSEYVFTQSEISDTDRIALEKNQGAYFGILVP